ncbi:MAG: T9SS type A sorting domain-containing protein [Bacteroidetes bacterium]|nr:T9SS type A sorting domain-containing protein [Bacteroidota bacterium]
MRRAVTVFLPLMFILLMSGVMQAQPFGAVIYVGDNSADIYMFDLTNSNFSKVEFYRGAKLLGTVNLNAGDGGVITDYNLSKGNGYQYQYRAYRSAGGFLDGNLIDGFFLGGDMRGILIRPDTINIQTDLIDTIFVWPGGNLHFAKNAEVSWILGTAGTVSGIKVYGSDDPATVWHGVVSASGGKLDDINIDCYGQIGPLKNFTFIGSDVIIHNMETESHFDNVTLNMVTENQRNDYAYIRHYGNKIFATNCYLTQEGQIWGVQMADNCKIDWNSTIVGSNIKNTEVNKGQITIGPAGSPTSIENCHIIDGNVSLSNKTSVLHNTFENYATLNISPFAGGFDPADIRSVHVNYNHFVRTQDAIGNVSNFQADSIDARYNYWGRCEGPKSGERNTMGKVFLDPFLRVEYPGASYWGELVASKKKIIANGEDSIVFTGHFFNVLTGVDTAGVVVRYRVEVQGDTLYNGSVVTDAQGNVSFSIKVPQKYSQITGMAVYISTDLQCIEQSFFLNIEKQTGPDLEVYEPELVQVLNAETNVVPHKGFVVKATILTTEPVTTPFKIVVDANGHKYETFYIYDRTNIGINYSMENPLTEMIMQTNKPVVVLFFINETGFSAGNVEVSVTVDPTEPGNNKGRIVEANELNNTKSVFAVAKNTLFGNEGDATLKVFVQGADGYSNPNRIKSWADSTAMFLEAAWPMSSGQAQFTSSSTIGDYSFVGAADTLLQETWQPYLTKVYKEMVRKNPASDRYLMGVAADWFETRLDKQEFNHGASQTLSWSGAWDFMVASADHWKHAAHSLGHSFGLRRADLDPDNVDMREQYNENFIGVDVVDAYDFRYNRIVSNFLDNKVSHRMKAKCFMGGSQLPDVTSFDYYLWISDVEYNALLGSVAQFTSQKSKLSKTSTVEKAVFIEGSIDSTSRAITFGPWMRVENAIPSSMLPTAYATHTFRVLDAGDQEIATYLYHPTFRALGLDEVDAMTAPNPQMETEYFAFVVPCPDNARRVVVEEGGNIVAERIISANKPVVSIQFPTDGQDVKEERFQASWSATDPDGETQFWYTVWFSTNRGATWTTLQYENPAMVDSIFGTKNRTGYMLRVVANDGVNVSDTVEVEFSILTSTERIPTPAEFQLEQNYPNPFNPSTSLTFTLPVSGEASLTVFDALGRPVATVVDGYRSAGTYHVGFDASGLASGTYLAVLRSGGNVASIRMTLAR